MLRIGTFLLLLLAFATPSPAALRLEVDAVIGFNGVFRLDEWAPVLVTVSNEGPAFDGTVVLETTLGSEYGENLYAARHLRQIHLPSHSRKRLRFTPHLSTIAYPLLVQVIRDEDVVFAREWNLRPFFTTSSIALVLSRELGYDFLANAGSEDLRVVYLRPELLPDRWYGYGGVRLLVVEEVRLRDLTQDQVRALQGWIWTGGLLLFSAGHDRSVFDDPVVRQFAPARPEGTVEVSLATNGTEGEPPFPLTLLHLEEVRGRVVRSAEGQPLLVRQPAGWGAVYFSTADLSSPPFNSGSPWASGWWDEIVDSGTPSAGNAPEGERTEPVSRRLIRYGQLDLPGHAWQLLVAGAYSGAGSLLLLRRFRRRRLWLLFSLWVLGATAAAYAFYGWHAEANRAFLFQVSVWRNLPGVPYHLRATSTSLFATLPGSYQLEFSDPYARVNQWVPLRLGEGNYRVTLRPGEDALLASDLAMRSWELRSFTEQSIVPEPLTLRASAATGGLRIHLENRSAWDLADAWIIVNGHPISLPPLRAGSSSSDLLPAAAAESTARVDPPSWKSLIRPDQGEPNAAMRREIVDAIFSRMLPSGGFSPNRIWLVGWVRDAEPGTKPANRHEERLGLVLVDQPLPVS